jgi:polyhydroxybutyrate depolymerase
MMQLSTILALSLLSFSSLAAQPQRKDRYFIRQKHQQKITRPGTYTGILKDGGNDRYYLVHIPKKYKPTIPTPVLFVLHGGGGYMRFQANDDYYKLITKSEKAGFIAVFPIGFTKLASGKLANWNSSKCCGDSRDQKIDEVGFLKATLEAVKK